MKQRDLSIDYAKGLAILLVYIGHSILYYPPGLFADCAWSTYLRNMITSCNMPLFFFISGLLFAYSKKSNWEVVKDKVRRLLIPYLFTMLLVVIAKQFMPADMAYNSNGGGGFPLIVNILAKGGDRWFVYVLMWIFLLSLPLRSLKHSKWLLLLIALVFMVTLSIELPKIFLINKVVWYIAFFFLGMYLNQFYEAFRLWNTKYVWAVLVVFMILNIVLVPQLIKDSLMKIAVLPITGTIFFMTMAFIIDDVCRKYGKQPVVVRYIAYCGRYSLQFYLFTFAYPVIRYVVVSVMHITSPLPVFTLVLVLQLVVMTAIVEVTRRIKILKIPMGY